MAGFGSAIGAVTGGILGGAGGGGPAGNTTTTVDLPDWLKDYYTANLSGAGKVRKATVGAYDPLLGDATGQLRSTINGDYLNPASNPYLAATGDILAKSIGRSVDSQFEGAGRYGSGAYADTLARNVGNALTQLYGNNYAVERGRQASAAALAPTFASNSVAAAYSPYANFRNLLPNGLSTTTQPYFQNRGAGILGGALAGSQIGNMFGGAGLDLSSILGGAGGASLAAEPLAEFGGGAGLEELLAAYAPAAAAL